MRRKLSITRDDFENWLIVFDEDLDRFLATLPVETRAPLDYSPESLDVLETWILKNYPNTDSILAKDQMLILDGLTRYIGETYRKALGGIWTINLTDTKDAFYGLPILTKYESPLGVEICPVTLATASADRRTGHYLRTVLDNYLRARNARNQSQ